MTTNCIRYYAGYDYSETWTEVSLSSDNIWFYRQKKKSWTILNGITKNSLENGRLEAIRVAFGCFYRQNIPAGIKLPELAKTKDHQKYTQLMYAKLDNDRNVLFDTTTKPVFS